MIIKMIKNLFKGKATSLSNTTEKQSQASDFENGESNTDNSLLDQFFEVNYQKIGYQEGYEFHNSEIMQIKLKKIKADYLLLITKSLDYCQAYEHQLNLQLQESKELSDLICDKINEGLRFNKTKQENLVFEKELVVMDEGCFMQAVHGYTLGFKQGANDYVEEMMISQSANLFNKPNTKDYA